MEAKKAYYSPANNQDEPKSTILGSQLRLIKTGGTPKTYPAKTGTRYYRLVAPKGSKQITSATPTAKVKKRAAETSTKFVPHCVNCCVRFTERNRKRPVSTFFRNATCSLVQMTEALEYIFGVSLADFNNYLLFTKKDGNLSTKNIVLCSRCVSELHKLYEAFKTFDMSSHDRSILKKSINWKKEQQKYKVQQIAVYRPETEECLLSGISEDEEEKVEMDGEFPVNDFVEDKEQEDANISSMTAVGDHDYTNTSASFIETKIITKKITGTKRRKQNLSDDIYEEQLEFADSSAREHPVTSEEVDEIQSDFEIPQISDKSHEDELCRATDSGISNGASPSSSENVLPFECDAAVLTSKEETSHRCRTCGKTFKSDRDLRKHKKIHLRHRVTCSECGISFPRQSALIEHTLKVHSLHSGLPFPCQFCAKEFSTCPELKAHLRIHPPHCPYCSKTFLRYEDYKIHLKVHEKEDRAPDYVCSFCERKYKDFAEVKRHRCNLRRGQHICTLCPSRFFNKDLMKLHVQKHSETFRHEVKCSTCGLNFLNMVTLQEHEKIHVETNLSNQKSGEGGKDTEECVDHLKPNQECLSKDPGDVDGENDEHSVSLAVKYLEQENQRSKNMNSVTIENAEFEPLDSSVISELHETKETPKNVDKIELPLCPVCKESFDSLPEFRIHVFNHRQNKDDAGSCTVCEDRFFNFEHIFEHKCRKREPYSCQRCQLNFYSLYSYGKHEIKHKTKFYCPICRKSFANLNFLLTHEQLHVRKPFSCIECGIMFENLQKLKAHKSKHDEMHTCTICRITFKGKFKLYLHEKSEHLNFFTCQICPKSLKSAAGLSRHMKSHNPKTRKEPEKRYKCELCEYAFVGKNRLEKHMTTHTGEKPFACSYCDMKFARKAYALLHEIIHTGLKRYPCTDCDERFQSSEILKRHQRTHTGVPAPFACKFCDKRYDRYSNLKIHERIHTGERPFVCIHCGKCFTSKSALNVHEKLHGNEEMNFSCSVCDKRFKTFIGLKKHMSKLKH